MAVKYELDLRDYIRILKKRRYTIIFSAVMIGVFSYVFARIQEPVPIYEASASVKIERNSSIAGLYMQSYSINEGDNLETQAKIIKSYPIMEKVAKRIGRLDTNLTSKEIRQNNDLLNIALDLKLQVRTERDGYTNIIDIMVTSTDPKFAQKLANTVAEVYKAENTKEKNKRSDDTVTFIGNQLNVVKKKLTTAEEKLKEYRRKNKLISLDNQSRITLNQLTKSESDFNSLDSVTKEIKSMIRSLENKSALSGETMEGGIFADGVSPSFKRLNDQLSTLRVELDTLLLVYTERHPEVMELKEQIQKTGNNMLKELYAQLQTMEKRRGGLKQKLKKLQSEFQTLPQSGLNLARLERDVGLQGEVYALLEEKYQEALIRQAEKVEEVVIVRPALEPYYPVNPPHTTATAFIGIILGMILGLVFAFISETLDTSIGTIEDVEEFVGVPVVGIIPFVSEEKVKEILLKKSDTNQDEEILERNAHLVSHFAPHSTLAESYRTLRTNIQFSSLQKNAKVILLTSSMAREGKSTTTANLSMTMAQIGLRTLLIDADLRKPMLNKIFGLDREPGLSDVLLGTYSIEEVTKTVTDIMMGKMGMEDIMKTPGIDNLNIITSGVIPPNPSELLNSSSMQEFIDTVREMYDVVIIDTTPILPATDAAVLGSKVDSVIIVYKAGQVARGALKRAKVQMDNVKANVLGIVLNALKSEVSSDFQDYRYDTYYSYGAEEEDKSKTILEKLKYYYRIVQEKFEQYTSDLKTRMTIVAISLLLMLGGMVMSESQFTTFEDKPVATDVIQSSKDFLKKQGKEDEREPLLTAGINGNEENQAPEEGGESAGGPYVGYNGEGPPKGGPPPAGVPASGPVDMARGPFWETQSFRIGLVVLVLLIAIAFTTRRYLSGEKETGEKEEEEFGEERKEEEILNGKLKDSFSGAKIVDLSLEAPVFDVPSLDIATGPYDSGIHELAAEKPLEETATAGFSVPDVEIPEQKVPEPENLQSDFKEDELLDFKFTIPGMEDTASMDIPELDTSPSPPEETGALESDQERGSLSKNTGEILMDSSYEGFAEQKHFGELKGEELPDFSDFEKIDFPEEKEEQKSFLEKIKTAPHPEQGALESFPEEEIDTSTLSTPEVPSHDDDSLRKPPQGLSSKQEEPQRAITWDTTPLPEVEMPTDELTAFTTEDESHKVRKTSDIVPDFVAELPGLEDMLEPVEETSEIPTGKEGAEIEQIQNGEIPETDIELEEEPLSFETGEPVEGTLVSEEIPMEEEVLEGAITQDLAPDFVAELPGLEDMLEPVEETSEISTEKEGTEIEQIQNGKILETDTELEEELLSFETGEPFEGTLVPEEISTEENVLEGAIMQEETLPSIETGSLIKEASTATDGTFDKNIEDESEEAAKKPEPVYPSTKGKRYKRLDRVAIEKRISMEMLEEDEDVNQVLEKWRMKQKEEIESYFRKKTSMKQLKYNVEKPASNRRR